MEDLRVFFPDSQQALIDQAVNIRIKNVEVLTAYVDLEPVAFNRGFYSVDMTFFFKIWLEVLMGPASPCTTVYGASVFNKKVILYGSDGSVKMFTSEYSENGCDGPAIPSLSIPKAIVQIADPIGLSARICEARSCCEPCCCGLPEKICQRLDGTFDCRNPQKIVYATIGIFTIVQIVRDVPMLIPAYDFCIPDKECVTTTDNPCELFRKIDFPTNEFFPPRMSDFDDSCCCNK